MGDRRQDRGLSVCPYAKHVTLQRLKIVEISGCTVVL